MVSQVQGVAVQLEAGLLVEAHGLLGFPVNLYLRLE